MKKVVVVTGASRGIGKAIALDLAQQGYDLWITYQSSDEKAKAVQGEIEANGASCKCLKFDVKDSEACQAKLAEALQEATPWGLVNNAGITRDGLFVRMTGENWSDVVDTALKGFYNVTQPIASAMLKKKEGRIVNISSVVGLTGNPGQVNYASAKAGLIGATKSLAQELGRRNILVNCVAPGFIETEMTEDLNQDALLKTIPLARLGKVEDVSHLVQFLLGDKSSYITGQVISVNGGMA